MALSAYHNPFPFHPALTRRDELVSETVCFFFWRERERSETTADANEFNCTGSGACIGAPFSSRTSFAIKSYWVAWCTRQQTTSERIVSNAQKSWKARVATPSTLVSSSDLRPELRNITLIAIHRNCSSWRFLSSMTPDEINSPDQISVTIRTRGIKKKSDVGTSAHANCIAFLLENVGVVMSKTNVTNSRINVIFRLMNLL